MSQVENNSFSASSEQSQKQPRVFQTMAHYFSREKTQHGNSTKAALWTNVHMEKTIWRGAYSSLERQRHKRNEVMLLSITQGNKNNYFFHKHVQGRWRDKELQKEPR